ncbi:MAG: M24 family metallopeptidase [Acidimicrobiales bacterium]
MTLKDRSAFTNKQRIYDSLAKHDLDAIVVAQTENVVYCSGFYNMDLRILPDRICMVVWPREGKPVFVVPDRRAAGDGQMSFIDDIRGYKLLDGVFNPHPMEMVHDVLTEMGVTGGTIGFEPLYLPSYHADQLRGHLPHADLVGCDYVMDEIRMVKTPAEIELLRFTSVQTEKAIANAYELARPGDTEKSIIDRMGYAITKLGADFVFANVMAAGSRTPLGHHLGEEIPVDYGDIIRVDYGGSFDGYVSDLVRMAVVGPPSDRQRRVYGALSEGQHEVIDWLGPGQAMDEIAAKMKEITGPKLPEELDVVGFGHSIGLGIHDRPFITPEDDRLTEPGMVMQIEHITTDGDEMYHTEDSVLFTETGVTLLSDYTDTTEMYVIE